MGRLAGGVILAIFIMSVMAGLAGRLTGGGASGAPAGASDAAAADFSNQQLSPIAGDVDCNGSADAVDALLILRSTARLPVSAACTAPSGDVNCNGGVDGVDASLVLRSVAGLSVQSPPGCPLVGVRAIELTISAPANGTDLVSGEQAVVTVTLNDQLGGGLTRDDFASLNLYMYGPQETTKTVTAVNLLNATTDRSKTPHHYINLLTNPDVQASGNAVTYTLKPVSDEAPGTYTVAAWGVQKQVGLNQSFELADVQIGTATREMPIVEASSCAKCHRGASSGKMYMHHIDTSDRSPNGSWGIDSVPARTCKACHNNDGYAAYRGDVNNPSASSDVRTPDTTVRRVHGVHMGEGLKNAFNTDPNTGNFRGYTDLVFPADVKNCAYCHTDNRWKTQPSRQACTACHDNAWFGEPSVMPPTFQEHAGGPQPNDSTCSVCHTADSGGVSPISVAHKVDPPAFKHTIDLALSTPANGKFYVAGEQPTVTITVKDSATGAVIDPQTMVEPADPQNRKPEEFSRGYLFVSGPREGTMPVLTAKAADAGPTAGTYAGNDFRVLNDAAKMDPRFTRTATSITYQLDDVAGLEPGTYSAWAETMPAAPTGTKGGWALLNFQVGTQTVQKKVATNCSECHGDTKMHAGYFAVDFNTDICNSCHDYKRQIAGKSGWTDKNNGYGAAPLARRVHGVHYGRYLDKPGEVHTVDYSGVIFPQDVRNCTKCHSSETSGTWKTAPSRVACLACHDTDSAITHAALNTLDATPAEPYSGDEVETCTVCHGGGKEFAVDKVHNVANPYEPPYRREPAE